MPFGAIGQHKWLRLLLLTTAIYLVLLPLWWQSLEGLSVIIAACADIIYHLFNSRVTITPDGKNIAVFVTASEQSGFGGQMHSSGLRLGTITYGIPMLIALVVSTRAESILAKLRALGIGVLAMLLLSIPAVMVWAAMTNLQLADRIAIATHSPGSDGSGFLYYVFHGYAFSQPVVAVAIWLGLMMLGMFKRRPRKEEAAVAAPKRNEACPCGSGRKFKRCCGRA